MMSFIDACKKHWFIGLVSQLIISGIAFCVALVEGFTLFIVAAITWMPGGKYGPPPTPTPVPVVKYGPPSGSFPDPGPIGQVFTTDNLIYVLIILGSLLLYAWTLFGWLFWGGILYLRQKDKK